MDDDLAAAQAAIQRAITHTDDATLREHLESIDDGLLELTDEKAAASTEDEPQVSDDLESLESKIVDVASETDKPVRSYLETARDEIDEYRRENNPDW